MKTARRFVFPLLLLFLIGTTAYAKVEAPASAVAPVDINQATAAELIELPNIGPKRAAQIIAHRQQKPFGSVDELVEIKGIGPTSLEKIRPYVTVKAKGKAKSNP